MGVLLLLLLFQHGSFEAVRKKVAVLFLCHIFVFFSDIVYKGLAGTIVFVWKKILTDNWKNRFAVKDGLLRCFQHAFLSVSFQKSMSVLLKSRGIRCSIQQVGCVRSCQLMLT